MRVKSDIWNGELVTAKDGGDTEALRREAKLLEKLSHPGVVALVALDEGEGCPRLLTAYAGRHSLSTWQPRRAEDLLAVFQGLSAALVYLHSQNVFHLNIRPEHVLIGASQQPILCSFSSARETGDPEESGDLAARDALCLGETMLKVLKAAPSLCWKQNKQLTGRLQSVATAAAAGRVRSAPNLSGQLSSLGGSEHATRSRAKPARTSGPQAERTSGPQAERTSGPQAERTSGPQADTSMEADGGARRFAAEPSGLSQAHPARAVRSIVKGVGVLRLKSGRPFRKRKAIRAAGLCFGVLALALMTVRLVSDDGEAPVFIAGSLEISDGGGSANGAGEAQAPDRPSAAPDPPSHPDEPRPEPGGSANLDSSETLQCLPESKGYFDVTGDGCAERVTVGSGFVTINGLPYPVGSPEDHLLIGDWNCDGVSTVALGEASGRIFVFDSWPDDEPLSPTLVKELEPPMDLRKIAGGECDRLIARNGLGAWTLPSGHPPDGSG